MFLASYLFFLTLIKFIRKMTKKTKRDYWNQIIISFVFLMISIVILYLDLSLIFLIMVFPLTALSLYFTFRAVKIFRTLEDKNLYPQKLNFLNSWAKYSLDKKRFKYFFIIFFSIGILIGYLAATYCMDI